MAPRQDDSLPRGGQAGGSAVPTRCGFRWAAVSGWNADFGDRAVLRAASSQQVRGGASRLQWQLRHQRGGGLQPNVREVSGLGARAPVRPAYHLLIRRKAQPSPKHCPHPTPHPRPGRPENWQVSEGCLPAGMVAPGGDGSRLPGGHEGWGAVLSPEFPVLLF